MAYTLAGLAKTDCFYVKQFPLILIGQYRPFNNSYTYQAIISDERYPIYFKIGINEFFCIVAKHAKSSFSQLKSIFMQNNYRKFFNFENIKINPNKIKDYDEF